VNEEQARLEPDLGWKGIAQGGLDVHTVSGNHFTIMERHANEVAQVILRAIDDAFVEYVPRQPDRTEVNAV
jgi:thioesterase domain-containing protein